DLPDPAQTNAFHKAEAARCASDQGKFWEMHDLLFAAQSAQNRQDLVSFAQGLGLDTEKFNQCMRSEKYAEAIRKSMADAKRMGIYGTPAQLIGTMSEDGDFVRVTKVLVGGDTYQNIRSALEELLGVEGK